MPLYALVVREYFGERVLGTAYGAVFFISCIGMGLGSYVGGVIHDALGSYAWLFIASGTVGGPCRRARSHAPPARPASVERACPRRGRGNPLTGGRRRFRIPSA